MIDPKYADLPGIAYDQPDIYETDDLPEPEQFQDLPEDTDALEKVYINAGDAFNKFKNKRVSSHDVDFSISADRKIGYTLANEWKPCPDEDETPLQRYQRLKYEVAELSEQFKTVKENTKNKDESGSLTDIIHQIENTGKELASLNLDKLINEDAISAISNNQEIRFKELQSQIEIFKQKTNIDSSAQTKQIPAQELNKQGMLKYQMIYIPDKAKVQDVARINSLEKRLGYLENIIGITNDSSTKCSQILRTQGLTKSIEKLMANACLLNSSQLDILENKVTSLLHKMDTVIQKKTLTSQESKNEKMILEMYDIIKQTENCSQVLPQTIDRMLSLSGLHGKAAEFLSQLKELENLQQSINGSLANNKTMLDEMQKNFGGNLEIISKDITSLNERVKKLQK